MTGNPMRRARILVMYHSESGHTKTMAELVGEGAGSVPDTEVRVQNVAETVANDLVWCDGIALGSPTHMGTICWEMKRWWDVVAQPLWPKIEGKIGCAFSSTGGQGGGGELGSPTHMGTICWEMKRWWDVVAQPLWPKIEGKIGCAFSSTGGQGGGGEL